VPGFLSRLAGSKHGLPDFDGRRRRHGPFDLVDANLADHVHRAVFNSEERMSDL